MLGLVGAAVRVNHAVSVGHYAGLTLQVLYVPLVKVFEAHLVGAATHATELGADAAGNMVRLQNAINALPEDIKTCKHSLPKPKSSWWTPRKN